tara:strand:- start:886 stop:1071 length:186 start_codon:yes stop_codon:yes gene_type:complete
MQYTKKQIDAAVDATSPMCFILHVTGAEYCDAVFVAMQLSQDKNGQLSQLDLDTIADLMPM